MNEIVLNGISSREITGLLIQELPPVVKPKIRTQIETVDGRDGDIVTRLGYEAYDRAARIGLHGKFDIDQVIRFFNSSGEAVFSNEPEKVYRYEILEAINFERLLRFRQADVIFHCQPFKKTVYREGISAPGEQKELRVINRGNVSSRPTVVITGAGSIDLNLNGEQILQIELGNEGYIRIDTESMNADKDGVLKNRLVIGNYDLLELPIGASVISWSGDLTQIQVENYSRWI